MSFFRNLFESKPAQTDQEYTISLVDQLLDGKASPYLISNLKEFSHVYPDEISSRGIPELIKALAIFQENDDAVKDLITIFANLLRSDNQKKEENAKSFLQCEDTIPNLVRNLDNKIPQIRVGSMHVLMMIASLQPSLFTESLTANQPQMIRLFGSISDQNEQISSKFVTVIPKLVENNPDFQQIVGFYAFDSLVNSINRERPEFLEALISVLKDNQINQSLFVNSGYLSTIEKMIKTPDEKILDLMLLLFDPYKNSNNIESFRKNLEPTNVISITCDNIIRNVYRPLNVHLLSVCIKGNSELTNRVNEKIPDFVRLALETRKSATVNNGNNSFLDGIDLFGELFESFVFESEEKTHFLNSAIINGQNTGFDSLTDNFLNLCTYSILIAPNCKSDFEVIFNSLISNLRRYETVSAVFKLFVCICWQSKDYCDLISSDDKLTILIRLLIDDKSNNNSFFVPNSDDRRNRYLLLLLSEVILFSGKNRAKISSIIHATILPYELEKEIKQFENTEFKDNSKFGQFETQIIQYINDHHLNNTSENNDGIDNIEFYKNECDRLHDENNELKSKLAENEDVLNSIKSENEEKNNLINSLQIQIDDLTSNINVISRDIEVNSDDEENQENRIKELQSENDKLNQEIQSLKEQNEKLQTENTELLTDLQSMQKQQQQETDSKKQPETIFEEEEEQQVETGISMDSKLEEEEQAEEIDSKQKDLIDNLMNEISQLKSKIQDDESHKAQLNDKIDELSKSNEILQEQNQTFSDELDQLRSSDENSKKQISDKNDKISELQSQVEQLKNKIERKSIETTELIQNYSKQISEIKSQQNVQKDELIPLLNKQIDELRNENNQQKNDFSNEKEKLIQNISNLQSENDKLQTKIQSIEDELEKYKQNHVSESLHKQVATIQTITLPEDEIEALRKENAEMKAKCNELENQFNQNKSIKMDEENNIDELLRIKVSELEEQLQQLQLESNMKDETITSLNAQVKEANKYQKSNDKVEEDLRNTNNQLQGQVSTMLKQIDELKLFIQNHHLYDFNSPPQSRINQNSIEILNNKLNSLQNENKSLKFKLNQSNTTLEQEKEKNKSNDLLQDQVDQLNNQLNSLQNENKSLKLMLNQSNTTLEQEKEKSKSNDLLQDQVDQLNNQLNSLQIEKQSLQIQLIQYKNQSIEKERNDQIIESYKEKVEQLTNQLNDLQIQSQKTIQKNEQIESEKDQIIQNLQEQIVKYQSKIKTKTSKATTIDDDDDSSEDFNKSLHEQTRSLIDAISNIENENKLLQDHLNKIENNNIAVELNFEEEEEEEESDENKHQPNESNNLIVIQRQQKLIDHLNNKIKKLEETASNESAKNDLSIQNERLKSELKTKTNEFMKTLLETHERVKDLKKRLTQAKKEKADLESKLEEMQSQQRPNKDRKTLNGLEESDHKDSLTKLNKRIEELQNQNSLLSVENQQLKNSPSKALISTLQEDKANLEEKVYKLNEEISKLKKRLNKEKETDSNDDILSSFPISPVSHKTAKSPSKSCRANRKTVDAELFNKLLTENELLKKDNENQSHAITDLQLMFEMQTLESETQLFIPPTASNSGIAPVAMNSNIDLSFPYASLEQEFKNLKIENEVLSSKVSEIKAVEAENRKLLNENMELKKLIRNKNVSLVKNDNNEQVNRDSPNLSDLKQKKALRVIGKLYLDNQQQKLNM